MRPFPNKSPRNALVGLSKDKRNPDVVSFRGRFWANGRKKFQLVRGLSELGAMSMDMKEREKMRWTQPCENNQCDPIKRQHVCAHNIEESLTNKTPR